MIRRFDLMFGWKGQQLFECPFPELEQQEIEDFPDIMENFFCTEEELYNQVHQRST